jgi:hypothetical protein
MSELLAVLHAIPWFGWVAIAGVVLGTLSGMLKIRYEHVERMEMIRQGLLPDGGKPPATPEV